MSCPANFLGLGGGGVGGRLFPHMSSTQLTSVELFQPQTKKKGKSQNVCDVSLSDQKPRCPRRGGREQSLGADREGGRPRCGRRWGGGNVVDTGLFSLPSSPAPPEALLSCPVP